MSYQKGGGSKGKGKRWTKSNNYGRRRRLGGREEK